MFHLALTFGLEDDPPDAVARAIGLVEACGKQRGVKYPAQGTIATSDGERLWAFRYSSEGKSRSLFFSRDVRTLRELYPERGILQQLSDDARLVVSEPIGDLPGAWNEVPEGSYGVAGHGDDQLRPFKVKVPTIGSAAVELAPDEVMVAAGPDAFRLSTPLSLHVQDGTVNAEFVAVEAARERLVLTWHLSYEQTPPVEDADSALARTEAWWREWSGRCAYRGPYRDEVLTSLLALKAMTDETTGAVIAAPTTSLPEDIGGVRNWDYRYCWLRDSVLALQALLAAGYTEEALAFRDFLLRVGTGDPTKIQIMYGIRGERRLTEFELEELPGYEGSKPVRVGNAASEQFQLDVYGEVMGVAFISAEALGRIEERLWPRWRPVVEHVETIWREPDDGIWETRGPRQHFTYSKVMACCVRPCREAR